MRWWWYLLCIRPPCLIGFFFIVLAHWNNNLQIDISIHSSTLSWFRANQSLLFLLNVVCLAKKQQIPEIEKKCTIYFLFRALNIFSIFHIIGFLINIWWQLILIQSQIIMKLFMWSKHSYLFCCFVEIKKCPCGAFF
jgi:hypothetical protein